MLIIMVQKIIVVSVKIKKLWKVKVSRNESSHFEKKQFKVVQHILGIFPIATTITDKSYVDLTC